MVSGILVAGILVAGILVAGILVAGILVDGILVDGILSAGILVVSQKDNLNHNNHNNSLKQRPQNSGLPQSLRKGKQECIGHN